MAHISANASITNTARRIMRVTCACVCPDTTIMWRTHARTPARPQLHTALTAYSILHPTTPIPAGVAVSAHTHATARNSTQQQVTPMPILLIPCADPGYRAPAPPSVFFRHT